MTTFTDWLESEMRHRKMSPADLARAMKKDQSVISRILQGKREPKPETLKVIASSLHIPSEVVFRAAGLLPPKPTANEIIEQAEHIINSYKYPETKELALSYLEFLRQEEEKGESRVSPARHPISSEPG
jgi:transcriptional regulator with XRE-family HTH domain